MTRTFPRPLGSSFVLAAALLPVITSAICGQDTLQLHARSRLATPAGEDIVLTDLQWRADQTAIVICDMWDEHWCRGATRRVAEMAPRMNEVVTSAREQGVLIIHCPSSCLGFYEGTPMRELARQAPPVDTEIPLQGWCHLDEEREGKLPIDDSDGGCDCQPQCAHGSPWTRQIASLDVVPGDAVTDNAEAYYLMRQRGIRNVIVMGVHTNMCVLGRPFSIRQMIYQGQNVVLMRDLTDSMYNSRMEPRVPHVRGTELVIEHIERFWCPTITSTDFTGKAPFRFDEDPRPHVAFVINRNHYDPQETLPEFAHELVDRHGYATTWIEAREGRGFVGLQDVDADALVLYARREPLTREQRDAIQRHLDKGRALIGLRTASHAFGPRGDLPEHLLRWESFDGEVLGGNYDGHTPEGSLVHVADGAEDHPILAGVEPDEWESLGSLYKTAPIDAAATRLLVGTHPGSDLAPQPVAWIRDYKGAPVFYTSLGHPVDFDERPFTTLLRNAIAWGVEESRAPSR